MTFLKDIAPLKYRAGPEYRVNSERFFHIMGQGWFLYTRRGSEQPADEQSQERIVGPFTTKEETETYLINYLANMERYADSESWRYDS